MDLWSFPDRGYPLVTVTISALSVHPKHCLPAVLSVVVYPHPEQYLLRKFAVVICLEVDAVELSYLYVCVTGMFGW